MKNFRKQSKKILITLFLLIFSTCIFSACSNSAESNKNVAIKDISEKISSVTDVSQMKQGNAEKLKKLYNIDSKEAEEFILYTASSNIKVNEIAVIKVKDSNQIEDIKKKIGKRIEKQSESFKDYLPKEYDLIEKHILKNKDNYVIFIISKDAEKIEKVIDESFK
ncbi:hypothetical protein Z959_02780 [Clostridium novyi B str. ATCC 27606]|uniref:DUF4358 domain-containing protein n=2 Tax=Clostridium TaxID=1485 RepID=A0AA40ISN0_CLONO|nr:MULTISPECIES: DUF4358 domain-containing protein [Clostridium]KEI11936.1 hypothetical protein Z958_08495 [Clostridium novyi B str. NCTC 9691]KEI13476.1 hypothetical protein Z959_02780 [Clostridium novyi B str. ATCC 27606]KEI17934.1 hypothetical protein Z960_04805 [Clostridium haemolyticum NCTC 9693]KGN01567.1 hypothetical protein Z961_08770 [Clostridium haemolyticum NCTC 8350]CAG7839734.1 hypothetical protein CLOHAE12215_01148 [Clostridium haemolyticum]